MVHGLPQEGTSNGRPRNCEGARTASFGYGSASLVAAVSALSHRHGGLLGLADSSADGVEIGV